MKKELNTDSIIREKLKDFSASPPQHVWDNVQASLAAQKRRKRVAYIAWISAAAVVLLAFIGGWYFNESQNRKYQSSAVYRIQPIVSRDCDG